MSGLFGTTALQLGKLMIFFGLGFLLMRKRTVPENTPLALSKLVALVFCPALTLGNLAQQLTRSVIYANANLLLAALGIVLVCIFLSKPLARLLAGNDAELQVSFRYNLVFSNYGYIGYPLILGALGAEMLSHFQLFCAVVSIFCYTFGRMVLQEEKRINAKVFLTPLSISIYLGVLIGFLEIPIPSFAVETLSSLGACTGPVAMLMAGMVLSHSNLRECFVHANYYAATLTRLVVLPLVIGGIMYLLGLRGEVLFFSGCFLCMPYGTNPIIFRQSVNKDVDKTMASSFLSYIFALITVPLIFGLFDYLQRMP